MARHLLNRLTGLMARQAPPGRHAVGNCLHQYIRMAGRWLRSRLQRLSGLRRVLRVLATPIAAASDEDGRTLAGLTRYLNLRHLRSSCWYAWHWYASHWFVWHWYACQGEFQVLASLARVAIVSWPCSGCRPEVCHMARGRQPKKRLTYLQVRQAGPGRYSDGRGLRLMVLERGGRLWRYWVQRIMVKGKRRDIGIGSANDVTLGEAREMSEKNQKIARSGGDPLAEAARGENPTFRRMYEIVTENRSKNWQTPRTGANWRRMFETDILPAIGDMRVADISIQDVRDIVEPEWKGRGTKGYLARQNIESVFAWAVANGYRPDNPAKNLKTLLQDVSRIVKHHASLPYQEAPAAMADWQELEIRTPVSLAVLFMILTAARLSEATGATWPEIDLAQRIWRVPAERMKARKVHTVPLADQTVEILTVMKDLANGADTLVFPVLDRNGRTRPVTQDMVSDALEKLGRQDVDGRRIVAHGFRRTFRVWTIEKARAPREICELALAHQESDATVAAYTAGAEALDDRRELMQSWADFILPRPWSVKR